jgi:hypothetical protein
LQPDIEFPPFAPAETGARPARREDDELPGGVPAGAPGELWLQMMIQAGMEAALPGLGLKAGSNPKVWADENTPATNMQLPWEKDVSWALQMLGAPPPNFQWDSPVQEKTEAAPSRRRNGPTRRRKKPSKESK